MLSVPTVSGCRGLHAQTGLRLVLAQAVSIHTFHFSHFVLKLSGYTNTKNV